MLGIDVLVPSGLAKPEVTGGGGTGTVGKDSQNFYLDFVRNDKDEDKYSKTITITKQPSNGALVTGTRANYTPNTGFTGKDTIKFTSVGTASDPAAVASEERTIFITVK